MSLNCSLVSSHQVRARDKVRAWRVPLGRSKRPPRVLAGTSLAVRAIAARSFSVARRSQSLRNWDKSTHDSGHCWEEVVAHQVPPDRRQHANHKSDGAGRHSSVPRHSPVPRHSSIPTPFAIIKPCLHRFESVVHVMVGTPNTCGSRTEGSAIAGRFNPATLELGPRGNALASPSLCRIDFTKY